MDYVAGIHETTCEQRRILVRIGRRPVKGDVIDLDAGMMLYPTGGKEDMWWEVEDENGNVGWVLNTKLAPMAVENK